MPCTPGELLEMTRERHKAIAFDYLLAALKAVALSPSPVCTGEHAAPCDCVGDVVRAAIAKAEAK